MARPQLFSTLRPGAGVPSFTVGLVNNMPESASAGAERQFHSLLMAAFPARQVHLRRLTCLDTPRQMPEPEGRPERYDALDDGPLPDALIVTGAEPIARNLSDEPIWPGVTWIADWAMAHGVPVIWSCLAGHAAAQYLDCVERVRLPGKLSGLFVSKLAEGLDWVSTGLPAGIAMPQSRYHGIPDGVLERSGYRVLVHSAATGADAFTKQAGADFLFLQGHPEYDADTLMREYRRDMRRYLSGARATLPAIPHSYFEPRTEQSLAALAQRAAADRALVDVTELNAILATAPMSAPWRVPASRLIGTWLSSAAGRAFHARTSLRTIRPSDTQRGAAA